MPDKVTTVFLVASAAAIAGSAYANKDQLLHPKSKSECAVTEKGYRHTVRDGASSCIGVKGLTVEIAVDETADQETLALAATIKQQVERALPEPGER